MLVVTFDHELDGLVRCDHLEEPGFGQGVPGKVDKYLLTHVNPVDSLGRP